MNEVFKIQNDLKFVTLPETEIDIDYGDYIVCDLQTDTANNYENAVYFYHGSHIASTMMVTDWQGNVTQAVMYAPFGEITQEYNSMWHQDIIPNFTFSGKILDEESGMNYFEARYLKPPSFISRDVLFEKYFWMSGYSYCMNSPLRWIDPTGMETIDFEGNPPNNPWIKQETPTVKGPYLLEKEPQETPQGGTTPQNGTPPQQGGTTPQSNTNTTLKNIAFGTTLWTGIVQPTAKLAIQESEDILKIAKSTSVSIAQESQALKVLKPIATGAKRLGYVGNAVNIGIHGINVIADPSSGEAWARLIVNGVIVGSNLLNLVVPGAGTGISVSLSIIESNGGFDWLYKQF